MSHISVLLSECLDLLRPERGGTFIDATLGMGGHSEGMLERAGKAAIRLLGIDQDQEALALARERLGDRIEYGWGNFADLAQIAKTHKAAPVDGILMDIGVSSYQIDTPERGFSFMENGPLDMRMDGTGSVTAASIVNTWPEFKLANLFFNYGEERLSRRIARLIVDQRRKEPFRETKQLADLIYYAYPPPSRHKKPHPATRVFQALRIEVNQELWSLERGLDAALDLLAPGGVLAVISFHSLEDRIVKLRFRSAAEDGFEILTKKPIEAGDEETGANSRSRSAKLRGIRRLSGEPFSGKV
jgi:16S rRNA (cytosine1402-N4)-methyltransferase